MKLFARTLSINISKGTKSLESILVDLKFSIESVRDSTHTMKFNKKFGFFYLKTGTTARIQKLLKRKENIDYRCLKRTPLEKVQE